MNLANKVFKLIDNQDGLASSETKMTFNGNNAPFIATYAGDNVLFGHVIVTEINDETNMLYHAITSNNELVAGQARVRFSVNQFDRLNMTLNWSWLTGDLSSGISKWVEIDA